MIVARLRAYLEESAKRNVIAPLLAEAPGSLPADLLASHAIGALIGLVVWWLDHDLLYSPEEMGHLFWQLVVPGIVQALQQNARASQAQRLATSCKNAFVFLLSSCG